MGTRTAYMPCQAQSEMNDGSSNQPLCAWKAVDAVQTVPTSHFLARSRAAALTCRLTAIRPPPPAARTITISDTLERRIPRGQFYSSTSQRQCDHHRRRRDHFFRQPLGKRSQPETWLLSRSSFPRQTRRFRRRPSRTAWVTCIYTPRLRPRKTGLETGNIVSPT